MPFSSPYSRIITELLFCLRKHFTDSFQHTHALVANDEFDAIQTAPFQPLEKTDPAGFVFFHALSSTQNLAVSVLIDRDCHQDRDIFIFSAPVSAQIDAVHIDIRILAALQRTVPPVLDMDVSFLIQLADC